MNRVVLCLLFVTFSVQANSQNLLKKISGGSDITVIIFLEVDCPISQKYIPTLNAVYRRFEDRSVKIHAVIPGKIKKKDIARFKEEYGIPFNVTADRRHALTKALSAQATPEVFVLDSQLKVNYRGAIDNWFYELGGYRKEATEAYLLDAVEALLVNKEPKIKRTKALGCSIQASGRG
jgi:peroxiredoxin